MTAKMTNGPPHTYRAECLAFHPREKYLAVADGDNHEVTLWDLDKPTEPAAVLRGAGSCLWGVAACRPTASSWRFRTTATLTRPIPTGAAPALARLRFAAPPVAPAANFKAVQQLTTADGWSIKMHPTDPYQWYAVSPDKVEFLLPRFKNQEEMPRLLHLHQGRGRQTDASRWAIIGD